MDHDDYLAEIRRGTSAIAAVSPGSLEISVPSCPDWDVAELITHTSWVYRWVTHVLTTPDGERPDIKTVPAAPDGVTVLDWFRESADTLVDTLNSADLDRDVVTLMGMAPARFWVGRYELETT